MSWAGLRQLTPQLLLMAAAGVLWWLMLDPPMDTMCWVGEESRECIQVKPEHFWSGWGGWHVVLWWGSFSVGMLSLPPHTRWWTTSGMPLWRVPAAASALALFVAPLVLAWVIMFF